MITYRIKPLLFFVVWSCLLMTGCSSSTQPIEYYQFAHSPPADQPIVKPTSIALVLADPVLFGAISNRGIAMKYSANRMRNARSHLWDQPLDGMLLNSAEQQLTTALPSVFVSKKRSALPYTRQQHHFELQWELTEFNGGLTQNAEISGLWRIIKYNNGMAQSVLLNQYFNVSVDLEEDGYSGLVQALEQAWQQVVQQSATDFEQLIISSQ